jgi:hypothetical protein
VAQIERRHSSNARLDRAESSPGCAGIARPILVPIVPDEPRRFAAIGVRPEVTPIEACSAPNFRLNALNLHALHPPNLAPIVIVNGEHRASHALEHTFECRDTLVHPREWSGMGKPGRYQPSYDTAREATHRVEVMRRGDSPQSLTDAEIERGEAAVTRAPDPIPVAAWVRYGTTSIRVDGFTSTWTAKAVEVLWRTPNGDTHRAWVWANAVRRRGLNNEERLGVYSPLR